MQGYNALWLPGMDHAGIATQNVVERELAKEGLSLARPGPGGLCRAGLAVEGGVRGQILGQMRRLGDSVDWSRERFTMDAGLSRAVQTIFKRLFDDGLIYRAERIINWCPRCLTALSDIEVDHTDDDGELVTDPVRRRGELGPGRHHAGGDHARRHRRRRASRRPPLQPPGRPGGRAPAVRAAHPGGGRPARRPGVRHWRGQGDARARPGRLRDRPPARPAQPHDHGRARRDHRARPVPGPGPVRGAARGAPRCASRAGWSPSGGRTCTRWATANGAAPPSSRGCRCSGSSRSARWPRRRGTRSATAGSGSTRSRWPARYFDWVDDMHDWCISRQLWWGHRIPVWYSADGDVVCVGPDEEPPSGEGWHQDPDVLDTWFSSALWPFSTLGWPDDTPDLRTFYPTSVLVTGYDILFFWVARMMMFGLYAMSDGSRSLRAVPRRGAARPGPGSVRQEDVEVAGQHGRPAGLDRPVRRRRHPVHPGPRIQPRQRRGHQRGVGGRAPGTSATSCGTRPGSRC